MCVCMHAYVCVHTHMCVCVGEMCERTQADMECANSSQNALQTAVLTVSHHHTVA